MTTTTTTALTGITSNTLHVGSCRIQSPSVQKLDQFFGLKLGPNGCTRLCVCVCVCVCVHSRDAQWPRAIKKSHRDTKTLNSMAQLDQC